VYGIFDPIRIGVNVVFPEIFPFSSKYPLNSGVNLKSYVDVSPVSYDGEKTDPLP